MRKKLIFAISLFFCSVVFFVISSSGGASQPHYQLSEFYQKFGKNKLTSAEGSYMTLYGIVKEGSIHKSGVQAHFTITQAEKELPIFFTGKTLLPDTLKDGSQAAVEGMYDSKKQIFIADKVMAKCASRYKSYPKNKS